MLKHGFCAGLRYDLDIRANAFQCNTIHKGKECFLDISLYREEAATKSLHNAISRDETQFQENPYIEGGPRDNIDPYTGRAKPNNNRRANNNNQGKKNQGRDQGNRYNPYSLLTLRGRNDSRNQSGEGGNDWYRTKEYKDKAKERAKGGKRGQGRGFQREPTNTPNNPRRQL
jgi:hypothetical protein